MRRYWPSILRIVVAVCLIPAALCGFGAVIIDGKTDTFREIQEVERHVHNRERWSGLAAAPSGIVNGGDFDVMAPYVPDAGNDDWGAWVLLLGTADTPVLTGMTKFDPHQLFITAAERNTAIHRIQVAWHATSATIALAAGDYTELMFKPEGATFTSTPIPLKSKRCNTGQTIWVRIWADGGNTGTLNMFLGVHEYES